MLRVKKLDEAYLVLEADTLCLDYEKNQKHLQLIDERFSVYAENYAHTYEFRSGKWDGMLHFAKRINLNTYIFPIGIFDELLRMCETSNIDLDIQFDINDIYSNKEVDWDVLKSQLNLPDDFEWRQYQKEYVEDTFRRGRLCIVSPTGSGKSVIIYMIVINLLKNVFRPDEKIIIVVPTVDLVTQMYDEFVKYGFKDIDSYVNLIYGGKAKDFTKQVTITTWQSLQRLPEETFYQFQALIIDECHGISAAANKLNYISHCCKNARFRIGTTGTTPEHLYDEMTMRACLGEIVKRTSTSELIRDSYLSPLVIKTIVLMWKMKEKFERLDFSTEYDLVIQIQERKNLIVELCKYLLEKETTGTILVLGRRVDYLKELVDLLTPLVKQDVYIVTGKHTVKKERAAIYNTVRSQGGIFFATEKIAGTGINIPNIDKVILATPIKAKVPILQAIGRGVRLSEGKQFLEVYDIIDKIPVKNGVNYSYRWVERKDDVYATENFTNKFYLLDFRINSKSSKLQSHK